MKKAYWMDGRFLTERDLRAIRRGLCATRDEAKATFAETWRTSLAFKSSLRGDRAQNHRG